MEKSSINGPFSMAMLNDQRVQIHGNKGPQQAPKDRKSAESKTCVLVISPVMISVYMYTHMHMHMDSMYHLYVYIYIYIYVSPGTLQPFHWSASELLE